MGFVLEVDLIKQNDYLYKMNILIFCAIITLKSIYVIKIMYNINKNKGFCILYTSAY